jgi:hypothetical protein
MVKLKFKNLLPKLKKTTMLTMKKTVRVKRAAVTAAVVITTKTMGKK